MILSHSAPRPKLTRSLRPDNLTRNWDNPSEEVSMAEKWFSDIGYHHYE